ncbi:hypothetical protein EP7_003028 [Isosphaeraceae bacterium EP7]
MTKSRRRDVEQVAETGGRGVRPKFVELRAWYELGRLNPAGPGELAAGARKLGLAREIGPATLRKARQFARTYSASELEALLAQRTGRGKALRWCHVRELVAVEDRGVRAELERQVASRGWSVRELREEIRRARGGGRGSEGGRKHRRPASAEAGLARVIETCEAWLRFRETVVAVEKVGLLAMLGEAAVADPGESLLDRMRSAERVLAKVAFEARTLGGVIEAHRTSAEASIVKRAASEKAEARRRKRAAGAGKS